MFFSSPYHRLHKVFDSLRLIKIRPAELNDAETIICDMTEVLLGEAGEFEALSYTWGDQSVKKDIILNGCKFKVGLNLFDALQCLRRRADGTSFWIDAICINQQDDDEKSRQIKYMRELYFRATTVVVWLGQKYATHQAHMSKVCTCVNCWIVDDEAKIVGSKARNSSEKQAVEHQMALDLINNPYWDRVWIIQEVGRAYVLQVSFGTHTMSWDAFMAFLKSHSTNESGAMRLARDVSRKYDGAYRLRELLYTHRHALCQNPRDKIYGLVGFAYDVSEFPINYKKSLMEVWADTMNFMNKSNLFDKHDRELDIAIYGSLIRFLLLGPDPSHVQQNTYAHAFNQSSTFIKNAWNSPIDLRVFHGEGRKIDELKKALSDRSRTPTSNQATSRAHWIQKDQYRDSRMRAR